MKTTFMLKRADNNEWYFVLVAKNGKVIATSETYKRRGGALKGIASVKTNAPDAGIVER